MQVQHINFFSQADRPSVHPPELREEDIQQRHCSHQDEQTGKKTPKKQGLTDLSIEANKLTTKKKRERDRQ